MKRWPIALVLLLAGLVVGGITGHSLLKGQPPAAPPIPKELTSYRDVVKRVLPAVVSIEGKSPATTVKDKESPRRVPSNNQQVPEEFRHFFDEFGQSPFGSDAEPTPHLGFGSGFLVDPKGIILTNNHVVDGASQVVVTLQDGRKFTSKDIKTDQMSDLAIVRLDTKEDLPFLRLGDSNAMEIGDRVLAVGAPFRLQGTVTAGIISSKGRNLGMNTYEDFLQTDAAINPGNSGGPLVNLQGNVIGINAAIKSHSGGWQGIGLAVSSNLAKNVMEQLETNGVVRRGFLGVHIKDIARSRSGGSTWVSPRMAASWWPRSRARARPPRPASRMATSSPPWPENRCTACTTCFMTVATMAPGKAVELQVVRDGKPHDPASDDRGAAEGLRPARAPLAVPAPGASAEVAVTGQARLAGDRPDAGSGRPARFPRDGRRPGDPGGQ